MEKLDEENEMKIDTTGNIKSLTRHVPLEGKNNLKFYILCKFFDKCATAQQKSKIR